MVLALPASQEEVITLGKCLHFKAHRNVNCFPKVKYYMMPLTEVPTVVTFTETESSKVVARGREVGMGISV